MRLIVSASTDTGLQNQSVKHLTEGRKQDIGGFELHYYTDLLHQRLIRSTRGIEKI